MWSVQAPTSAALVAGTAADPHVSSAGPDLPAGDVTRMRPPSAGLHRRSFPLFSLAPVEQLRGDHRPQLCARPVGSSNAGRADHVGSSRRAAAQRQFVEASRRHRWTPATTSAIARRPVRNSQPASSASRGSLRGDRRSGVEGVERRQQRLKPGITGTAFPPPAHPEPAPGNICTGSQRLGDDAGRSCGTVPPGPTTASKCRCPVQPGVLGCLLGRTAKPDQRCSQSCAARRRRGAITDPAGNSPAPEAVAGDQRVAGVLAAWNGGDDEPVVGGGERVAVECTAARPGDRRSPPAARR